LNGLDKVYWANILVPPSGDIWGLIRLALIIAVLIISVGYLEMRGNPTVSGPFVWWALFVPLARAIILIATGEHHLNIPIRILLIVAIISLFWVLIQKVYFYAEKHNKNAEITRKQYETRERPCDIYCQFKALLLLVVFVVLSLVAKELSCSAFGGFSILVDDLMCHTVLLGPLIWFAIIANVFQLFYKLLHRTPGQ
jgi:hypothetical protein